MPAGVSTSQAMSESASSTPGMPKLWTSRLAVPAPRSSTGTSRRRRRGGTPASWRVRLPGRAQTATRAGPPAGGHGEAAVARRRRRSRSGPRTPTSRPASVAVSPPRTRRVTEPESGTTTCSHVPGRRSRGSRPRPAGRHTGRCAASRRRRRRWRPPSRRSCAVPSGRTQRSLSLIGAPPCTSSAAMSTAAATSPSGRVEQGPADDQAPDGGQLERAAPARRRCPAGRPAGRRRAAASAASWRP